MLTHELYVMVAGSPIPKGSLKCIGQRGRHQLIEDNPRTKEWRAEIARGVRAKITAEAGRYQPLGAEITFTLKRPKTHYRTNGDLKEWALDRHPTTHGTGDVDKLLRLVLDALQDALLIPDDAAVCEVTARKHYTQTNHPYDVLPWPGVVVRLYPL